jgi:hypothetical protein
MTIVRKAFHIASVSNGEDAVSYEIVPSTRALSVDANGNWASGTVLWNQDKSCAVVKCYVYKVVGSKRELCKGTVLYYTAEGSKVAKSIFNNGFFYVYVGKSASVIDACVYAFNMAIGKPVGDPLAMASITINHDGTNGKDGASVTCQYASNDTGPWHNGFEQGTDFYMRVKTGDGTWNVMRIVGEKGADGVNGSYTKYDFAISAKETTTDVNTQPSDIKSADWQDAPLKTTAAKPFLWYRVTHYDSKGKPGIPSYVRMNGKDGANGTSINIKGKKDAPNLLPQSGANLGDCYLIAGELWVYVNGDSSDANVMYGFVNCGSIKGEPGENATQYYYHIAWAENITKDASGKITATGFSTSDPAGIGYPYMGVCYTTSAKDPSTPDSYKWVKVEGKPIVSYEIRLDTDSVTADGKTGKFLSKDLGRFHFIKHTGDKSEELDKVFETDNYIVIYVGYDGKTAEYSLGDGSGNIYDCLMMNTEEEAVSLMKFFWYDAPVYVSNGNDKDYDYVEELKATQGIPTEHMNLNILSSAVFTVIRQPKDGERGSAGAIWRHHKGFVDSSETEPYEYMAGGSDEKFIDAVLIGKIWYRCILKYESTGRTDTRNTPGSSEFGKYWSAADMSMAFIATDFFLAENAKINLFGSNEINLYSSSEDGKIFGSFRVPNGNGDGSAYALWLGAETGSEAPFSVTNRGYLKATDAEISGTIMAKGGSIGGFKINEDALGSNNGYNMYLTNDFIHFGNWGAFFHNAGYNINLGYQNRHGIEVSSFSSDTNNINVGGYFHVTANSEKDKGSYCAALELASLWATGAGDIDMTDAEKGNHAILIQNGDVAGLRPSFVRIDKNKALSCYNYNIECYNTKDITLTLPDTEGIWGQHLVVIQRGDGKVIFTSTCNIHDLNANKDSKTWFSGTRGQVSYFWFNGTEWLVRYINR